MEPAAGYLRCSTDKQDYSIGDQKAAILEYAEKSNVKVVRWFIDEGKSGIAAENRPGLMDMISLVEKGYSPFSKILVYDVSRWGRYGDPDEAGYWEFHCRRHGVQVLYTNEEFKNDGSIGDVFVKTSKRVMAGEYSKDLSRLSTRGCKTNARLGFRNGAPAPYGMKRILVDNNGKYICDLRTGEHKFEKSKKVKLAPGAPEEIEVIRRVFNCYVSQKMGIVSIVNLLNKNKIPSPRGGKWCVTMVWRILTNETYTGTMTYGKGKSGKYASRWWEDKGLLKTQHDRNNWILVENAHDGIIAKEVFEQTQIIREQRCESLGWHKNGKAAGKPYNSPYRLTRLIVCDHCGHYFHGHTHKSPTGKVYRYYEDGGYTYKGTEVCTSFHIPRDLMDNFVIGEIAERVNGPFWIDKLRTSLEQKLTAMQEGQGNMIANLNRRIVQLDTKINNLLDTVEEKGIDRNVRERLLSRQKERQSLEREKKNLEAQESPKIAVKKAIAEVLSLLGSFEEIFGSKSYEEQKAFIRLFVARIVIARAERKALCYFRKIPILKKLDSVNFSLTAGYQRSNTVN